MADLFKRIREYKPLVHIITNAVAINDSANFVIAAGGKPICGYDKAEVEDITGLCDCLMVNIGMPNDDKKDGILLAVNKAKAMNIPVVLDPVGISVSQYRQNQVRDVISTGAVSAIRGNRLEIEELIRTNGSFPYSITVSDDDIELFARENRLIIMATGERDYIWGNGKYEILENGTVWQSRMTGCGCALSALIAAALGSCNEGDDIFDCCVDALRSYNEAAEIALYRMNLYRKKGSGSFRTYLADAISDGFACREDLRESLQLYAITDQNLISKSETFNTLEDAVIEAIDGGITMLQYRDKNVDDDEFVKQGKILAKIAKYAGIPFIINDRVELVTEIGADGVHVGQDDMAVKNARDILGNDYIIGATAHNVREAVEAQRQGADYLGVGAAFGSETKSDAKPIDLKEYQAITSVVDIPVCAIGGIDSHNIERLAGSGVAGIAVISGIFAQTDICKASQILYKKSAMFLEGGQNETQCNS